MSWFYFVVLFNGVAKQLVPTEHRQKMTKSFDLSHGTETEKRKCEGGKIFLNFQYDICFAFDPLKFTLCH